MIVIVDYGMGNIQSVKNALDKVDATYIVTRDPIQIMEASGIIIPGVGSFEDSMNNMHKYKLVEPILYAADNQIPILGICLGMQILFTSGIEGQPCRGLGLLKGNVVRMSDENVKVPHMGWNQLKLAKENPILVDNQFMYFVHSYCASDYDSEDIVSYVTYGSNTIVSSVAKGNVVGMQFHPEKSGKEGIDIIRRWKELCV